MTLILFLAGGVSNLAPASAQQDRRVEVVPQKSERTVGDAGRRWALVIGVDRYRDPTVPRLLGAVADAKAIADALVRYADFLPSQVVTLVTDGATMPTSAAIVDALATLRNSVKPGDLFLCYFAGHGVEVEGRRFLLTYEAQLTSAGALKTTSMPVSNLMQEIESLPVSHRIIMVDACRDDPLNPGKGTPNVATALMEAAFTLQPSGVGGIRATFLSCSRGESAYEWTEKGRGFFSYCLERALAGEAAVYGKVTLNSLADYLNENVPRAVRRERGRAQTPFSDVKGESFTLVRGEKLAVTPEHLRAVRAENRTLYGVVKDGEGQPLPGAPVRLTWEQGATRAPTSATAPLEVRVSTDEDGFFKAEVPALAVVSVFAEASGFQIQTAMAPPQESGKKIRLFLARIGPTHTEPPLAVIVPEASPPPPAMMPPATTPPATVPVATLPPATLPVATTLSATASGAIVTRSAAPPVESAQDRARELARVAYQSFLVEEFESAERSARRALENHDADLLAQTVVANCLAVRGVNKPSPDDLGLARELSRKLLDRDSKNAFAHNASGLTFIGGKDLKSAEREFATAVALDPTLAMSEANLGHVRLQLGKLKEAEKAYRSAIRSAPDAAVSYNGLAQVLLARGEATGAAKAARAAISRYELQDVYLAAFYVNLAVALHQGGKRDQALEAVARARALGLEQNPAYEIIESPVHSGKNQKHR